MLQVSSRYLVVVLISANLIFNICNAVTRSGLFRKVSVAPSSWPSSGNSLSSIAVASRELCAHICLNREIENNNGCLGFEYLSASGSGACHIVDKFHTLVQSDVLGESDDEFKKKNVFLLLNVDGSLPFPVIWSEAYSHTDQFDLTYNNKLTTLPVLPIQWRIRFEFMLQNTDRITSWLNILLIFGGSCGGIERCRMPAVFFQTGQGLNIQMRQEGVGKTWVGPGPWLASSWIEVLISQEKEGSEVVYTITINGEEKFRWVKPNAEELTNMDVYARDGIHAYIGESLGLMRGLSIQIGQDQDKKKILHGKL